MDPKCYLKITMVANVSVSRTKVAEMGFMMTGIF